MSDELGVHVGRRNAGQVFQDTQEFVFRYHETTLPDQLMVLEHLQTLTANETTA